MVCLACQSPSLYLLIRNYCPYLSCSAAGYCFAKASKVAAFAIGASILGLAVCFLGNAVVLRRLFPLQLANQSGYVDIHFDRIRDTAHRQLTHAQQVARAAVPQPATTNIDGEEIETFIDQASPSVTDSVS